MSATYVIDGSPGAVAGGNVYTDWTTMMADVVVQRGLKWIEVFGSPMVPAETWNVDDCIFVGRMAPGAPDNFLYFADGAQLQFVNLALDHGVRFSSLSTSPVFTSVVGVYAKILILNASGLQPTVLGMAPFIRESGANLSIVLDNLSFIGGGSVTDPTCITIDAGHKVYLSVFNGSRLFDKSVTGAGTLLVNYIDSSSTLGTNQPGLGSLIEPSYPKIDYAPAVPGNWASPAPTTQAEALDRLAAKSSLP